MLVEFITINFYFVTSVNELTVHKPNIFPIPAQNYINILLHNRTETINNISISSIDGRTILTTGKINNYQTRIELPEMQNGIYIIHVNTNYKSYSSKFDVYNQ